MTSDEVVILGGNVCGIGVAVALSRAGYNVKILERGRRLTGLSIIDVVREDQLSFLGVEPHNVVENEINYITIVDNEGASTIHHNRLYVCRITDLLERAAAYNQLRISFGTPTSLINQLISRDTNIVIDCESISGSGFPVVSYIHASKRCGYGDLVIDLSSRGFRVVVECCDGVLLVHDVGNPNLVKRASWLAESRYYLAMPLPNANKRPVRCGRASNKCFSPLGSAVAELIDAAYCATNIVNNGCKEAEATFSDFFQFLEKRLTGGYYAREQITHIVRAFYDLYAGWVER
ncbi:MAG: hypothetical protein NXY59_07460 [Aigarchaeota archaeon]|nr:hypothetical protein [Candidatus Pelearchaeum maunauluense]